ncbi:MAG: PKD domain-containing protein [Pseudomonadota bacterium]|nr:PKD domain-containing protein [Pseudomonadota bacterium]
MTWNSDGKTIAQQFDSSGTRIDGELRVDTLDNNANASGPSVVGLANGAFAVSWQDYDYTAAIGGNYNVYQQIFGNPATITRQANPVLTDLSTSVTFAENVVNLVPQIIDSGVGLLDPDSANFDGGILEINYLTDYGSQDQLGLQGLDNQDQLGIRNQGGGAHQIGVAGNAVSYGGTVIGTIVSNGANGDKLTVQFNANASVDAVEHVIENLTYANTVSNPIASRTVSIRVTDGDGGASDPHNVVINVTPEIDGAVRFGQEKVVNTTVAGNQQEPSVARLSAGGYVVVWTDQGGADGSSYGVYGQRYDANDNAAGTQFRVNTTTSSDQSDPHVVGLNGGGFVAVWTSNGQDGSGYGVYGQRYKADGTTDGTEFLVNTTTSQSQYQPTIAATVDGGFAVAWYYNYYNAAFTEYADIFFQRYNAAGVAQGGETRANPLGEGTVVQSEPTIAGLSGGGFITLWTDDSKEGNGTGIYGQRFAADGTAAGGVLHINSYISSTQNAPEVAALKDGGFVAVWQSEGQDLSSTGIYSQRFDASGVKVGAEFRVNTNINSTQYQPDVTALENGGWVVSWSDGANGDVFVQQYNGAGQQIDGETRVDTYGYSTQYQPSITSMADGGFVVAYTGYIASGDGNGDGIPDGGNDTYEIRTQRFSNTAPNLSNISVSGQEEAVIVLKNTLFEGGFVDPEGQSLQAIKIITLPAEGLLKLNGFAVTANQEISLAYLQAGVLTYQGRPDYFGADQFRWTGSDGIAFATTSVFTNIVLSNVNDGPRLGALTDATGTEGSLFSRSLVVADPDPEGHQITVNWGDGTANSVFTSSSSTPQIQHIYADNGTYAVLVTADDQQGQANSVESKNFSIVVGNVAPTIALVGDATVVQGLTYTLDLGNPSDPGTDTVNQYTVNWGDGSAPEVYTAATLPANGILTHTFTAVGPSVISVGLRDEDGTYANAGSKTINVAAPAEVITVDAGADLVVNEGTTFSKTISFTDPTDQGPAGRVYTAVWGDGQTSTGSIAAGATSFNISHAYADNGGPFTTTVTVNDDNGVIIQKGSDSFLVNVSNVAPVVTLGGAGSVSEGSTYVLTLNPSDPGTDTISQYTIRWGDGATQTVLAADLPVNRQLTHLYADGDVTRTIGVDVIDEDGTFLNAGTSTVFVANVAPTAAVSGADAAAEGSVYTLTVGAVSDPGADTRSGYSINWGDGSATDNFTAAQWTAAAGSFTHTFADGLSTPTIVVSATDEDGTFQLGSKLINVSNVAPVVVLSGNGASNEGAVYTLNIVGSDAAGAADPLSYSINWGDGSAAQTLTAAQLAALGGNVVHTYADDQDGATNTTPRTISVSADDGDAGITTKTQVVNVNNVAPSIALGGAASTQVGQTYTLNLGTVTDPGLDTVSSYQINWGDGSAVQSVSAAGNITHTYASTGNLSIAVALVDEDGTFANAGTLGVVVGAAAQTVAIEAGVDASVNEGSSFSRSLTFSDGVDNGAAGWSYSIDYGDGSSVVNGSTLTKSIDLSHVYADGAASSTVAVSVTDVSGESASDSFVVNVANVAPTAAVSGADAAAEGSVYTLTVGAVSDPGADTRSGYSINWGDGSATDNFTAAQWTAAAGSFTHTFADGLSTPTIVVSATDEDGTFQLGSKLINVSNVAPVVVLSGNGASNEGAVYTLNIVGSDAAGAADPLSYSINWGDGSAAQTLTAAQLAALGGNVVHTYADDQDGATNTTPRTISVSADDGDAGITTKTQVVNVNNVAPSIALGGAASTQVGQTYTLNLGTVTDPGLDTVSSYQINWGDGSAVQSVSAAGNITHTYASTGNLSIAVALVDEDGTFANAGTLGVVVGAAAQTVAIEAGVDASVNEGSSFSRSLTFSDGVDNGAAGWSYSIDYGDGSSVVNGSTLTKSIDLSHVYADGAASSTVAVSVTDVSGESASDSFVVNVANVAPTIALGGTGSATAGQAYTLNLGSITDPGQDTVATYTVNWGDGGSDTYTHGGGVTHTYAGSGSAHIAVSLTDEDGTFANAGTQTVNIDAGQLTTLRIGDAPLRQSGTGGQWKAAWTNPEVAVTHTGSYNDGSSSQTWTAAKFDGVNPQVLSGGDILSGDLGVSGQSAPTDPVKQMIDGHEALRFDLKNAASSITVKLSNFFVNDDGGLLAESGRLRLVDSTGHVVGETTFEANSSGGSQTVALSAAHAFVAVELMAGAYDGSNFVFGGLGSGHGSFGAGITTDTSGVAHGSDFLVDWVEFSFAASVIGVPNDPLHV